MLVFIIFFILQHEREQFIQSEKDRMDLIALDNSICGHNWLMSIKTELPDYWRLRYKSDGTRHIEKSRVNPLQINVCMPPMCFLNNHVSSTSLATKFKRFHIESQSILLDSTYVNNYRKESKKQTSDSHQLP